MTGEKGMAQETRERVVAIAERLHYYPNLQARGLVAKKSNVIGIVIPRNSEFTFSNPFYIEVLKGIGKRVRESGQYLLLSFSEEGSYAKMYQHGLAAGIIVLPNRMDDLRIAEARKMQIPMVLIPGYLRRRDIPSVNVDNADGAFQAVRYLADLGHRRIAFVSGPLNSRFSVERLAGFRKGLKKYGLPFQEDSILEGDFTQEGGYSKMKEFLSRSRPPTAVLTINDFSAMGALRAAKEMAYRIPQDVSLVGFGDTSFASVADPPLTTVRVPYKDMGYEAADLLLRLLERARLPEKHRVLAVELIIRNSTSSPCSHRHDRGRVPRAPHAVE
jgi:LacI family transcriptional regulator